MVKKFSRILDFVLVNNYIVWNMSAQAKGIISDMVKTLIGVHVAELMLNWKDLMVKDYSVSFP